MQAKFYIVRKPEVRLDIKPFRDEPLPILWDFDGQFCVIPKGVVENAIRNQKMYDESPKKQSYPRAYVHWDQGVYIDNEAGRALIGE